MDYEENGEMSEFWGCCGKKKPDHREECQYYGQENKLFGHEIRPEILAAISANATETIRPHQELWPLSANSRQVGGEHYKKGGEEHWDRAWRLKYDPFQYIITKWVERWRDKGGVQDLEKAQHAIQKYIEVVKAQTKD